VPAERAAEAGGAGLATVVTPAEVLNRYISYRFLSLR